MRDAARAIVGAAEHYNGAEPVNVGSVFEISIRELAEKIQALAGYGGKVIWDDSKPDGQPRRKLDVYRAEQLFGFRSTTEFDHGLEETVDWYRQRLRSGEAADPDKAL